MAFKIIVPKPATRVKPPIRPTIKHHIHSLRTVDELNCTVVFERCDQESNTHLLLLEIQDRLFLLLVISSAADP